MKLNTQILKGLKQAQTNITLDEFADKIDKCFNGKAFVEADYEASDLGTVKVSLDSDSYPYFKKFMDKVFPYFSFDDIYLDYDETFKYENDGFEPRDGHQWFAIEITFDELYDLKLYDATIKECIEHTEGNIDERTDSLADLYSDDISKLFGGIDKKEVKFLLYRLIEGLE